MLAAHAQLDVGEAAVLGHELLGLARRLRRLHEPEAAAVVGRERLRLAAQQLVERHAGLARQRVVERHVEHRERHLGEALVAQVREALLAGIVHGGCIGEADLAALDRGDQLLDQRRQQLLGQRNEGEAQRAANPAALGLQVDQQERHARELADARVERAPHGRDHGADADAGDLDGAGHAGLTACGRQARRRAAAASSPARRSRAPGRSWGRRGISRSP